ncbi:MAG: helix-turn-helix domain-containing protein [Treponema sp.]|nr:helix-turn-helix domain-containing protein [Treponema sp.]
MNIQGPFKACISPTDEQRVFLNKTHCCCCFLYNNMLNGRNKLQQD